MEELYSTLLPHGRVHCMTWSGTNLIAISVSEEIPDTITENNERFDILLYFPSLIYFSGYTHTGLRWATWPCSTQTDRGYFTSEWRHGVIPLFSFSRTVIPTVEWVSQGVWYISWNGVWTALDCWLWTRTTSFTSGEWLYGGLHTIKSKLETSLSLCALSLSLSLCLYTATEYQYLGVCPETRSSIVFLRGCGACSLAGIQTKGLSLSPYNPSLSYHNTPLFSSILSPLPPPPPPPPPSLKLKVTINHNKQAWPEALEFQQFSPLIKMLTGNAFICIHSNGKVQVTSSNLNYGSNRAETKFEGVAAKIVLAKSFVTPSKT